MTEENQQTQKLASECCEIWDILFEGCPRPENLYNHFKRYALGTPVFELGINDNRLSGDKSISLCFAIFFARRLKRVGFPVPNVYTLRAFRNLIINNPKVLMKTKRSYIIFEPSLDQVAQ